VPIGAPPGLRIRGDTPAPPCAASGQTHPTIHGGPHVGKTALFPRPAAKIGGKTERASRFSRGDSRPPARPARRPLPLWGNGPDGAELSLDPTFVTVAGGGDCPLAAGRYLRAEVRYHGKPGPNTRTMTRSFWISRTRSVLFWGD